MKRTYHSERIAIIEKSVGRHRIQSSLMFHFPLFALFFHLLAMRVWSWSVVDQSEFQQRSKDERQTYTSPHVNGLKKKGEKKSIKNSISESIISAFWIRCRSYHILTPELKFRLLRFCVPRPIVFVFIERYWTSERKFVPNSETNLPSQLIKRRNGTITSKLATNSIF